MDEEFAYLVLEIVSEIPKGYVASYSDIAKIAGRAKNARLVGKILSNADYWGNYPCHRVLHNDGSLVSFWKEQRELLKQEKIDFLENGKVDMKKYRIK